MLQESLLQAGKSIGYGSFLVTLYGSVLELSSLVILLTSSEVRFHSLWKEKSRGESNILLLDGKVFSYTIIAVQP